MLKTEIFSQFSKAVTIFFVLYNPVLYGWIFLYLDFTQ